MTASLSSRLKI